MKINKNLVKAENKFFPATSSQTYLIRILFERLNKVNDNNELEIAFKEIRELFGTDIRQKFVNDILDEILASTFVYEGKEYKYIDNYVNHFDDRCYTITFPADTVALWLKNTISYDFNVLKDLKSNKFSIVLYEYFKTGATEMSLNKFYDFFNKDGYVFFDKKREFLKSVSNINDKTDIQVDVSYNRQKNLFDIKYL
jgi:hypothetical protein